MARLLVLLPIPSVLLGVGCFFGALLLRSPFLGLPGPFFAGGFDAFSAGFSADSVSGISVPADSSFPLACSSTFGFFTVDSAIVSSSPCPKLASSCSRFSPVDAVGSDCFSSDGLSSAPSSPDPPSDFWLSSGSAPATLDAGVSPFASDGFSGTSELGVSFFSAPSAGVGTEMRPLALCLL